MFAFLWEGVVFSPDNSIKTEACGIRVGRGAASTQGISAPRQLHGPNPTGCCRRRRLSTRRYVMAEEITYYAIIDDHSSRERPAGVLRRIRHDSGERDETFGRDLT